MKKFTKENYFHLLVFAILLAVYVLLATKGFNFLYGSSVDWDCQHYVIPDYFRQLFYKTGNLLPSFAFNLGNGQNIFNFSYYGLLNPIILISYLFPFIDMAVYVQASSIAVTFISVVMFYRWIFKKYDSRTAFLSSLLFMFTVPILFHSHRHIMFVNYMPFLIMGLMGIDLYFENGKKSLITFSVFLMIMTSYFYSVSGICALGLYAVFKILDSKKNIKFKEFFKEYLKVLYPVIVGVLMAMIIILPTLYVLLSGRAKSNVSIDLIKLFVPSLNISKTFYSAYSISLTAFSFLALIMTAFNKDNKFRLLSIFILLILLFPIFSYVLNGTMYVDGKVFITFIPIVLLITADFIYKFDGNKKSFVFYIFICIFLFLFNIKKAASYLFLLDFLAVSLVWYLSQKKELLKKYLVFSIVILTSISSAFSSVSTEHYMSKKSYLDIKNKDSKVLSSVLDSDNNIYRVTNYNYLLQNINRVPDMNYYTGTIYSSASNKEYKEFYYNVMKNEVTQRSYGKLSSVSNIFDNMYNATKYIVKDRYIPVGYRKVDKNDNLYVNDDVLPIIYSSSNLMSKTDFEKLFYPYNMEALLKYVIVDENVESTFVSNMENYDGNITFPNNFIYKKNGNDFELALDKKTKVSAKVDGLEEGDILIVKFDLDNVNTCSFGDVSIAINDVVNVLTCKSWKYHNRNNTFHYVISQNEKIDKLDFVFSKGTFKVSNLEMYKINYKDIKNIKENVSIFNFDKKETKGDIIKGAIDVKEDGYFYMSIPYDKGFEIYLNGVKTSYEKIDNNFLGAKIKKGHYDVEIKYKAPYLNVSYAMSGVGILLFISIIYCDLCKKNKKRLVKQK